MGYQALLFCPDEKLARVVSQVFSELDFTVDAVTEPFSAVKKLMAQRYDAVVIDCDNEQNSSLLIKSGRTSVSNQSSLAIAMVEGQAGVARAYRIGANLVLTKPINVEQAKGTLRVARGLLRKNLEAAAAAASAASPAPAVTPVPTPAPTLVARPEPATRTQEAVSPAVRSGRAPEFETSLPAAAASPKPEEKPALAAAPALQNQPSIVAQAPSAPAAPASPVASEKKVIAADPPKPAAVAVFNAGSGSQGAGSAPAPAKEIATPRQKSAEKEKQDELFEVESSAQTHATFSSGAESRSDAPSFAALGDENTDGGSKKLLIAAAAVLVVAVGGYFGWSHFGQGRSSPAPQPVAAVSPTPTAPAPDVAPAPSPAPVSSASTSSRPTAAVSVTVPKTPSTSLSVQSAGSSSSPQNSMLQSEAKTTASAPLVVKSATAKSPARSQAQPDASAAQLPSPLSVASPTDSAIGGLLASASSNVARPSLATIRVSQGVSQGMVIKRVQPKYPPRALSAHIQGAVQIEATVNKEGIVVNPKALSGDSILAAAALEAVRQWRYKPYYLDGEPVEIQTQITINFRANQ